MRRWLRSLGTSRSDRTLRAIRECFDFLGDEYGFIEADAASTGVDDSVTFENSTTFVQVLIDRGDVVVFLGPVRSGAFPPSGFFEVGDLATVRGYTVAPRPKHVSGQLAAAARTLRDVGTDVLQGDFSCLPAIRDVVERRRKESERQRS